MGLRAAGRRIGAMRNSEFKNIPLKDVLEIIMVFSARLYGSRSRKNQKLLDNIRAAAEDTASC
jgi:predicted site-specific integrase-resolvase